MPITSATANNLVVIPTGNVRVAAWLVADGGTLADGVELTAQAATLVTTIAPGSYTLVVTGLSRGSITTEVDITLTATNLPEAPEMYSEGCSAGHSEPGALLLLLAAALVRRRATRS